MFLLPGGTRPEDRASLASALREGLRQLVRLADGPEAVLLEGGAYPRLGRLRMDLTGAEALTDARPPTPPRPDGSGSDVHVDGLEIAGRPLWVAGARVWLDLRAAEADFAFRHDRAGNMWLALVGARDGAAEVRLAEGDLETLLRAGLETAAARQGVRVEGVRWALRALGPRAVGLDLWVTALRRVVFKDVRATVHASGRVDIDDRLDATVYDARVEGDGPVGGVVANLAAPYLRRFEGRAVPLTGLPLGVELRDVRIDVSDGLRVTATFG